MTLKAVGLELIVTMKALLILPHPVLFFLTVKTALYVPDAADAGITSAIGLAGRVEFVTSTNPAAFAVAS